MTSLSIQRSTAFALCLFIGWISTVEAVRAQVTVFQETFDLVGDPAGWTLEDGWSKSTSTPSSGSGMTSLQHSGSSMTNAESPALSLGPAASATLSYLARRTGAYAPENLTVSASADGGLSFPFVLLAAGTAVPAEDSKWELISVEFPDSLIGSSGVVIRFEGQGLSSASANLRIDDVTIVADVPVSVFPASLGFEAAVGGEDTKPLTLTNHTSETITISPPSIVGDGFSIDPTGSRVLAAGGMQVYSVKFSPASPGTVMGSTQFDFGSGQAEVSLFGAATSGMLGFATDSSAFVSDLVSLPVPLRLTFDAGVGLQGLQFRISWHGDVLTVSDVQRGDPVSDESVWTLSHEVGSGFVDVVLLGHEPLAEGVYDRLLEVHFEAAPVEVPTETLLSVEAVIGALAVPEGLDADVWPSSAAHLITVLPGTRVFDPSATFFDLGLVPIGDFATATLTVSNTGGNDTLDITHVDIANELFEVSPVVAAIPPDEMETFTISFAPLDTLFGRQDGQIIFAHTGESGTDTVTVTAKGTGGRGDVDSDGSVDILDLVHSIDFILNRLIPDPLQEAAADLYPFSDGDGELDVRDLTVLLRAIAGGVWPDGIGLPVDESNLEQPAPGGIMFTADPFSFELSHGEPIRAAQVVLPASPDAVVDLEGSEANASVEYGIDRAAGELRVLIFRQDGSSIQPGSIRIATRGVLGRPSYVTVIGEDRTRLTVDASVWTGAEPAAHELPEEAPYPNPFRVGVDPLVVPTDDGPAEIRIYDVLGRTIVRQRTVGEVFEWSGKDASGSYIPAGIYLIEISSARTRRVRSVQAIR